MANREQVEHNGNLYSRWPDSKQWSDRSYYKPPHAKWLSRELTYLHRQIWIDSNGPIPTGYHVHHKDGNPSNNDISNLECLSTKEHGSHHKWSDDRKALMAPHLERAREMTKVWHASPEGHEWHKSHAHHLHKHDPIEKSCEVCSASFLDNSSSKWGRFCSLKCKAKWRRDSGLDNVKEICKKCGTEFEFNKYAPRIGCSRKCSIEIAKEKT